MPKARLVCRLMLIAVLAACGKEGEPDGEQAAAGTADASAGVTPAAGTAAPADLPPAIDAAVLLTDVTLGGRCVFDDAADTAPGASLASVQLIGADGNAKGYGRLLWDAPGFAVADPRGTAPDGTPPAGATCNDFYNIGCDGQAVFEIVGANGDVQKLRAGDSVIVHLRGQETCGEAAADEVEGAICNDPEAAASGKLSSCTFRLRMVGVRSDLYGPDRVAGKIRSLAAQ